MMQEDAGHLSHELEITEKEVLSSDFKLPSPWKVFWKAMLRNPRSIGACCPSSKRLARTMAAQLDPAQEDLVVELGAGTGVVTQALVDRGLSTQQLLVIERDPKLATYLKQRFPDLKILQGDAAHLAELVKPYRRRVSSVVSSLPLLSLPSDLVQRIGEQLSELLGSQGQIIQFTYRLSRARARLPEHFARRHQRKIWLNIPPARVEVYWPENP